MKPILEVLGMYKVKSKKKKGHSGLLMIKHRETGHFFIGYGRDVRKCLSWHMAALRNGIHPNLLLQKDYRQFGEDKFWYGVILYCEPSEMICYRQRLRYDAWYNPLYERLDRRKLPMTTAHKQLISLAMIGKRRIFSDTHRQRLSDAATLRYERGDDPLAIYQDRRKSDNHVISEVTKGVYDEPLPRRKN